MSENKRVKSGFSLIEIAIIIVIMSIVGSFALNLAANQPADIKVRQTLANIAEIKNAMLAFYSKNGYLPCPAALDATGAAQGTETNCSITGVSGVTDVNTNPDRLRTGAIPYRTLNVLLNKTFDGWNNKIVYSVPTELAISANQYELYNNTAAALQIIDGAGNNIASGDAAFVLHSPGTNRKGAFSALSTTAIKIIPCTGAEGDVENCDDDNVFRQTLLSDTFDDVISYTTLSEISNIANYQKAGAGNSLRYSLYKYEFTSGDDGQSGVSGVEALYLPNQIVNTLGITTATLGSAPNEYTVFTIPAGKYLVRASAQGCGIDNSYITFWLDGADAGGGNPSFANSATPTALCNNISGAGVLNLANPGQLEIRMYHQTANAIDGHGRDDINIVNNKNYREIEFWRID